MCDFASGIPARTLHVACTHKYKCSCSVRSLLSASDDSVFASSSDVSAPNNPKVTSDDTQTPANKQSESTIESQIIMYEQDRQDTLTEYLDTHRNSIHAAIAALGLSPRANSPVSVSSEAGALGSMFKYNTSDNLFNSSETKVDFDIPNDKKRLNFKSTLDSSLSDDDSSEYASASEDSPPHSEDDSIDSEGSDYKRKGSHASFYMPALSPIDEGNGETSPPSPNAPSDVVNLQCDDAGGGDSTEGKLHTTPMFTLHVDKVDTDGTDGDNDSLDEFLMLESECEDTATDNALPAQAGENGECKSFFFFSSNFLTNRFDSCKNISHTFLLEKLTSINLFYVNWKTFK